MKSLRIILGMGIALSAACSLATAQQPMAQAPTGNEASIKLAATVNGWRITMAELDRVVRQRYRIPPGVLGVDPRIQAIRRSVLSNLIDAHLLLVEARQRKLVVHEAKIKAQLQSIRSRFPNEDAFLDALKAQGLSLQTLRGTLRDNLMRQALLDTEVEAKLSGKEEEARAFFEQNRDRYTQAEAIHARHILIKVPPSADRAQKELALKKLQAILQQARDGKHDFADLARTYSEGPSGPNGGDLGYFNRGQMVPSFEAAAWALKPGEISNIVETQFGFHIIKLEDYQPEQPQPFKKVIESVRNDVLEEKRRKRYDKFVGSLRQRATIVMYLN